MKQEDKKLLLKDLCARLPYRIYIKSYYSDYEDVIATGIDFSKELIGCLKDGEDCCFEIYYGFKPYLRPMSNMTEKEMDKIEEILGDKCIFDFMGNGDISLRQGDFTQNTLLELYDFYNSIHIDYRGLISKGLAIEVTEENNPYK